MSCISIITSIVENTKHKVVCTILHWNSLDGSLLKNQNTKCFVWRKIYLHDSVNLTACWISQASLDLVVVNRHSCRPLPVFSQDTNSFAAWSCRWELTSLVNVPSACRRVRTLDKQISIIYGKGDIPPVRFNTDINNKLHLFTVPFKCKAYVFLFSKEALNSSKLTFIMFQKISNSNKCCLFKLSIHKYITKIWSSTTVFNIDYNIHVSWAANLHIIMISEGSCDTNDAENAAAHHRNTLHWTYI